MGFLASSYLQTAARSVVTNLTGSSAAGGVFNTLASGARSPQALLSSGSFLLSDIGNSSIIPRNALYQRNYSISTMSNPENSVPKSKQDTTGGPTLTYPSDQAPYFLQLIFYKYDRKAPLSNTTTPKLGTVNLPLPGGQGLIDNTTVSWTENQLGVVGNVLDELQRTGTLKLGSNAGFNLGGLKNEKATGDILARIGSEALRGAISSGGSLVSAAEAVAGVSANPSLAMIFRGISDFRRFQFSWLFAPKSKPESDKIREIVRFIKARQMPTLTGTNNNEGSSLYFNYPAIVKPAFSLGSQYMTDFKFCVIHSVSVNYSPRGSTPTFYKKSSAPTFVELTMDIQEMEYVLSNDYDQNAKGEAVGGGKAGKAIGDALSDLTKAII